jgi:nucleotidyltransferase substrate binding protein (TIGR01987 family)
MGRWAAGEVLDLEGFRRALEALERALVVLERTDKSVNGDLFEVIRSGVIQNFEVAYEMAWKAVRRCLTAVHGAVNIERLSRRELFRLAARADLIDDVEAWMSFHEQRNNLAHRYVEEMVEHAIQIAENFANFARKLLGELEACH